MVNGWHSTRQATRTIGECILDALSGPRRHRFGAVRDLILGVTVALADGTVASSGGKVVKNVAGYDLAKLFCGSGGTLGLVVRAAFRLHPRPASEATVEVAIEQARDARNAVRTVQRSTLVPSALDLLWPGCVVAMLEGSPGVVRDQVAEATRLAAVEAAGDIWSDIRRRQADAGGTVAFAPGELEQLLRREDEALVRPSIGVAYVDGPAPEQKAPGLRELRERVRRAFDPEGVLVG